MISLSILYSASFCNNKWSVLPLQAILWINSPSPWLRNLFQMLYYCFFITHSELLYKPWGYAFINIICALQFSSSKITTQYNFQFTFSKQMKEYKVFTLQFSYVVDWKGASYWRASHPKQRSLLCSSIAAFWIFIAL